MGRRRRAAREQRERPRNGKPHRLQEQENEQTLVAVFEERAETLGHRV